VCVCVCVCIYIYIYILISISDNDADSNSATIFAFSGICTASLTMTSLHIFPNHGDCLKREHHQSLVLISDHSPCGEHLTWAYKLPCFGSLFLICLVKWGNSFPQFRP
jgi:hypothetical protein